MLERNEREELSAYVAYVEVAHIKIIYYKISQAIFNRNVGNYI